MALGKYVLERTLLAIPVLVGVSAITFALLHLAPGDPIDVLVGFDGVDPSVRDDLRTEYGLDDPVWQQYLGWVHDALFLEFGESPVTGRDVEATIAERLPATLVLGLSAWVVSLAVGIPAGVLAAVTHSSVADETGRLAALAGIAVPNFWLGLVLLFVFGVQLGWVRVTPPDAPLLSLEMLWFMVLPTLTLAAASAALVMRLLRASMRRELEKEYVRTARAKGLSERTVILKHALRNSLTAVVTVAGLQIAFLVDGAVVVEQVFSWPGMGQLLVEAIDQRDFPVVQAAVLLIAVSVVVANLLVDVVYAALDPRIRYDR